MMLAGASVHLFGQLSRIIVLSMSKFSLHPQARSPSHTRFMSFTNPDSSVVSFPGQITKTRGCPGQTREGRSESSTAQSPGTAFLRSSCAMGRQYLFGVVETMTRQHPGSRSMAAMRKAAPGRT